MSFQKHIIYSSKMLLVFMTGVVCITSLGFFFGITINAAWFIIPAAAVICTGYYYSEEKSRYYIDILICSLIVLFAIQISMNVYDLSYDGACYHKLAVGLLKEGWNPVYMRSNVFNTSTSSLRYSNGGMGGIWEEAYPKATWYFAAVIYKITDNIEAGKCYTLLFAFVTFGICLDFFIKKNSGKAAVLISLFIAFHPIACAQFQTYYLDGVVACVLSVLIVLFIEMIEGKKNKIISMQYLLLFSCIIWGCNLKFSVVVFIVTFCFLFCILSSWRKKKLDIKNVVVLLVQGSIAVFVIGFAPYITNILRHGDMFYSFSGLFSEQSIQDEFGIAGLNGTERFLVSLFSRISQGGYHTLKEYLKIPFTFSLGEIFYYSGADARSGGFGIFFSGLFLIAIVVISVELVRRIQNGNISWGFRYAILLFVISFIEFLFLPQTSQFRYIPHMYLCVIFGVYLLMEKSSGKVIYKLLNFISCVFIIANIMPWGIHTIKRFNEGADTTAVFKGMAQNYDWNTDIYEIGFCNDGFVGIDYNLKDFHVKYIYKNINEFESGYGVTYSGWVYYKKMIPQT